MRSSYHTDCNLLRRKTENGTVLFYEKKAALIGVSQGRAGNLRGIEQLTMVLHYLKINVYHNKLPVSGIDKLFDNSNNLNEETMKALKQQVDGFVKF